MNKVYRFFSHRCGQMVAVCAAVWFSSWAQAESAIRVDDNPTRWTLATAHSSCQIILTQDHNLTPGWYGPIAGARLLQAPDWSATVENGTLLREIPYRGGMVDMEPALEVIFADHSRELELIFQDYEILQQDGYPLLRLDMKDSYYPLAVSEFIRVLPELDLLEKWLVLKNSGAEDILLEKTFSGSALLPAETDLKSSSRYWRTRRPGTPSSPIGVSRVIPALPSTSRQSTTMFTAGRVD